MSVSTLTLALATFSQLDVRAIDVGKSNQNYYHVFYKSEGKNRVMLVPRRVESFEELQREVGILLSRSNEAQQQHGFKDAPFSGE